MTARKLGAWFGWMAILGALSACLIVDDDTASATAACSRACECFEPLPSQQGECNAECQSFAPQLPVACLDCLAGLDCPDLPRGACLEECNAPAETFFIPQENE